MSFAPNTNTFLPDKQWIRGSLPENRDCAIVIGASMAGLAVARVLSDHYREVILVERDRFGDIDEHRRGVPQSRHAHGLLAGGRNALEGFFPGLFKEVLSAGAVRSYMTRDAHWCFEGGEHVRFESDLEAVLQPSIARGNSSRASAQDSQRSRLRRIPGSTIGRYLR